MITVLSFFAVSFCLRGSLGTTLETKNKFKTARRATSTYVKVSVLPRGFRKGGNKGGQVAGSGALVLSTGPVRILIVFIVRGLVIILLLVLVIVLVLVAAVFLLLGIVIVLVLRPSRKTLEHLELDLQLYWGQGLQDNCLCESYFS